MGDRLFLPKEFPVAVIDLSLPIFTGMAGYPGDPPVAVRPLHTLDEEGWRLAALDLHTHVGTHVNVPWHMVAEGKTLDELPPEAFFGPSRLYREEADLRAGEGVVFDDRLIDTALAEEIVRVGPKFVAVATDFPFAVELERRLLAAGIVCFENLVNTGRLPVGERFQFYGFPLPIENGDGSPVRAVAMVD